MDRPAHRAQRYQAWIGRHPVVVLATVALMGTLAGALASRLELKTAFSELLPSNDPGVVALDEIQNRIGDMSLLLVGIHSPDPDANVRYAEELTNKIRALPKNVAALATYNVRDVRDFFKANKWLYLPEKDLETIHDRLRSEITQRKNPLMVDLSDDDDESIEDLEKRVSTQAAD